MTYLMGADVTGGGVISQIQQVTQGSPPQITLLYELSY